MRRGAQRWHAPSTAVDGAPIFIVAYDVLRPGGNLVAKFGRIIQTRNVPELFAAMPPIESLEYPLRGAARDLDLSTMHVDFTTTYFCADAACDICVKLPAEDQEDHEHDVCTNLAKAMYRTRNVAQNWKRKCSEAPQPALHSLTRPTTPISATPLGGSWRRTARTWSEAPSRCRPS